MSTYTSYRFGAGRYIQEPDALEGCGDEVIRFGTHAFVIGGVHAWQAVRERLIKSFEKSGLTWIEEEYSGFPSYAKIEECKEKIEKNHCDVIVGIGGGKIMDLTKATASAAGIPVVLIPTSAATCASFSPLSVIYTDKGKCEGYLHFDYEVNAVIADEQVMANQPPRLLAAGIMDAMAKYIEIANGKPEITLDTDTIEKYSAYTTAEYVYKLLEQYGEKAYQDVTEKKLTKTVHDVVFCVIALTGIVSALMRARKQTALAHRMYETIRTLYYAESMDYLHGEIVATGLIAQLKYNQNEAMIGRLTDYMKLMEMPMNLQELGLDGSEATVRTLYDKLCESEFVPDNEEEYSRLWDALKEI